MKLFGNSRRPRRGSADNEIIRNDADNGFDIGDVSGLDDILNDEEFMGGFGAVRGVPEADRPAPVEPENIVFSDPEQEQEKQDDNTGPLDLLAEGVVIRRAAPVRTDNISIQEPGRDSGSARTYDLFSDELDEAEEMDEEEEFEEIMARRAAAFPWRVVIALVSLLIVTAVGLLIAWRVMVKPPEINNNRRTSASTSAGTGQTAPTQPAQSTGTAAATPSNSGSKTEDTPVEPAPLTGRNQNKYSFLLMGMDNGYGNTDTIMVATFDVENYTLNVVSIPRDTMVNVSWSVKKANSIYCYGGGMPGAVETLADILGYEVDFYARVKLSAFVKLVDAVGGIDYYVPRSMNYEDPEQGLYIHVSKGQQHLDGATAVQVMRFRSGYEDQDIGRIGTQQDFLKAAAAQIIAKADKLNLNTLVDLFVNYVDTDLTTGNLIWFAKEFFKMDVENINFYTVPGNYEDVVKHGGQWVSYVSIYPEEWVQMLNATLNPFYEDILLEDLNILTRDPETRKIYSTSGVYAGNPSWGN